jgi:histidyl-tRNA synthetase
MKNEIIKGFRDYEGKDAEKRAVVREVIRQTFEKYGFSPAETPIIESEEFVRGENEKDEAVSDIYTLKDKGKRKLALRYEFTFQLRRLIKNKKLPFKRYQIGSVFRNEPITGNRVRQFTQCDADIAGATIKDEAEILAMTSEILKNLKIEFTILFNNRKLINEILDDLKIKKNKEKIMRELDKIDKQKLQETQDNLMKLGAGSLLEVINQGEKYFVKFDSYKEIIGLIEYCKSYGVEVKFAPSLVRGLSYYDGFVFEVKTNKMKESIVGGGSYKFNNIPCTGVGFGLERLCSITDLIINLEKYLIISLEQDREAIKLAQKLRKQDKIVSMYYGKPSKALEYANAYGFQKVIFVGAREIKNKKFKVKIMKTGREILLKI